MLRQAKIAALKIAGAAGLNHLVRRSGWRRERLLILCYHGIAIANEDQWNPELYMSPQLLRRRMEALRDSGCTVLPLDEAMQRLHAGTLPNGAVSLTFDDGAYDFYAAAWPILREFGFPVTVYLTTYYSEYNRPVFDTMLSYLLWWGQGRELAMPETGPQPVRLDDAGRSRCERHIRTWVTENRSSAREKDALLGRLAAQLSIDYEALCRTRLLHIMTPAEAEDLALHGVDIQLHTHRHRVSASQERFAREIDDNRRRLPASAPVPARHFCYPGGFHLPSFPEWLRQCGVVSATTCQPGIVERGSNAYLLPRLVDGTLLTDCEFRSWLSGLAALLPHRTHAMSEGQLLPGEEVAVAG
jgi:peptidoglycan/xylan/chitin deacetylase (PgdA/CDA1 family)